MTHIKDAQCKPVRLDQYVNHDPQLIFDNRLVFKAELLLVQLRQTPGLYSRPGLYLRPCLYSRKYGMMLCDFWATVMSNGSPYVTGP